MVDSGDTTSASVAPLVGAWIEIFEKVCAVAKVLVAPLVGAWIEIIFLFRILQFYPESLPLWERGLKSAL